MKATPFRQMPRSVSSIGQRGMSALVDNSAIARTPANPNPMDLVNSYALVPAPGVNPPNPAPNEYVEFGGISVPVEEETPVRQSWWLDPPPGFRPFDYQASIAVPAAPTETTVLTMLADTSFGGVLHGIVCCFVGTGFVEGSGDLTWRLLINGNPHDGYGQVIVSLGQPNFQEVVRGGIIFMPRDTITVTVTNINPALATGRTVVRLAGYKVPESVIGPNYRG